MTSSYSSRERSRSRGAQQALSKWGAGTDWWSSSSDWWHVDTGCWHGRDGASSWSNQHEASSSSSSSSAWCYPDPSWQGTRWNGSVAPTAKYDSGTHGWAQEDR